MWCTRDTRMLREPSLQWIHCNSSSQFKHGDVELYRWRFFRLSQENDAMRARIPNTPMESQPPVESACALRQTIYILISVFTFTIFVNIHMESFVHTLQQQQRISNVHSGKGQDPLAGIAGGRRRRRRPPAIPATKGVWKNRVQTSIGQAEHLQGEGE